MPPGAAVVRRTGIRDAPSRPLRSPSDQIFPGGSQGFSRENAGLSPGFSGNHPVFFPKNAKVLLVCQRSAGKTVHLCCRPPRGGRGLKWCCPSQMACCSPFSFIVSFLFPLYISRSKNRPIIPLHSTQRARPPRRAPEASGTSPSLRFLQLAQDLLAHRLLWILRREILDLRCVIP